MISAYLEEHDVVQAVKDLLAKQPTLELKRLELLKLVQLHFHPLVVPPRYTMDWATFENLWNG